MICVIMDWSWRHEYELMFSLYRWKWLHMELFTDINMSTYTDQYTRMLISLLSQLRESRSTDIPVAISKPTTLQPREPELHGEMTNSRLGAGDV